MRVDRDLAEVSGSVQNMPGNAAFTFYPDREWAYGGEVFVDVLLDGTSLGRHSFTVRPIPTLIHGFITGAGGEPVADARVEIEELGYTTTTNSDGGYAFGWGWRPDKQLPPGRYTLRVNADEKKKRYGTASRKFVVHDGEINAMAPIIVPKINLADSSALIQQGMVSSLLDGKVTLDLTQANSVRFADGASLGVARATLQGVWSLGKGSTIPILYGFGFVFSPAGIEVSGPIDLEIDLPELKGSRAYTDTIFEDADTQPMLWLLALDPVTDKLAPVGVLIVDKTTKTAALHGTASPARLDILAVGWMMPNHISHADAFVDGSETWQEVLTAIAVP